MIDFSQISVVVQGNVINDKSVTRICLERIRTLLPQCEIILSTWEGVDLTGLSFDKVILNKDPGPLFPDIQPNIIGLNLNRQIVSTKAGLLCASKKFTMKIRTDSVVDNIGFLEYFYKYKSRSEECRLLDERVLISSLYTRNPRKICRFPYHYSDTFQFGLTKDLLMIWGIDEVRNYNDVLFSEDIPADFSYENCRFKYIAEQYIYLSFIKKFKKVHIDFKHANDLSNRNVEWSEKILANNFVVLEPCKIGIKIEKFLYTFFERQSVYSHQEWLSLYYKFCEKSFLTALWSCHYFLKIKFSVLYQLYIAFIKGVR